MDQTTPGSTGLDVILGNTDEDIKEEKRFPGKMLPRFFISWIKLMKNLTERNSVRDWINFKERS